MAAPGDFVRGADGAAVGRVESVLRSASGERILVARAFLRGGYAVLPASEVVAEEKDGEGLNWLTLDAGVGAVEVRGTFRRALGHLTPDPSPTPYGHPREDDEAEAELRTALREDPLTRDGAIEARVRNGVAVLSGLIGTVGGKVAAERLARAVPGVWEAVNRLYSDEELLGAVRMALRRAGTIADAIQDVRVAQGAVCVSLLGGDEAARARGEIERVCRAVDGVRATSVVTAA